MSFIRPELAATARRFREALVGAGLCALALWAWVAGAGIVAWLAVPLAVAGAALGWAGLQRGRFRGPSDGPGVVQITEAQIGYFGPLTGGAVAVDGLMSVTLDPTGRPHHWVLHHTGGAPLHVPVTARGADALLDAFAQLPGFRLELTLRHMARPGTLPRQVWVRDAARGGAAPVHRLH